MSFARRIALLFMTSTVLFPLSNSARPGDTLPTEFLTLAKGDGTFGIGFDYRHSTEFFDSSGSKLDSTDPSFPDCASVGLNPCPGESFYEFQSTFEIAYGLTDRFTLWMDVPLIYRNETDLLKRSSFGLGDVKAGLLYSFWRSKSGVHEAVVDLAGRFPSGDTDLGYSDPQLPLGTGNSDLGLGFSLKQRLHRALSLDESASYTFRFAARTEYLRTNSITIPGSPVPLPAGNLRIDWGDEINARARLAWNFWKALTFAADGRYFYRRPTTLHVTTLTNTGGGIIVTPQDAKAGSAYLLFARPALLAALPYHLHLELSAELPLMGDNWPTLALSDGLVGTRYHLELTYGF